MTVKKSACNSRSLGAYCLGGHGAHLTVDSHGGLESQSHDVEGLDHIAGQNTLEVPIAVGQGDEDVVFLGAHAVDTAQDTNAGTRLIGLGGTQLNNGGVGIVQTNADRLGQRGILLNDDLLRLLQNC